MRVATAFALCLLLAAPGCRRPHQVGDHVLVEWRSTEHPAVIVAIEGSSKFRVHYDGYSEDWDELVPGTRILARIPAMARVAPTPLPASTTSPKEGAHPSASASAKASASNTPPAEAYRVGDRVRVEWHGATYTATIVNVLGPDRYRVHYEGYGNEWDETVGLNRIRRK